MMKVLGRYIDQHAQHVVITRQGDVVRHTRFRKLAEAVEFADSVEIVAGRSAALAAEHAARQARQAG